MIRKTLLLAMALAVPATAAQAQATGNGISWSYFDMGFQRVAPDSDALDDGSGLAIRGAGAINENWHVFLGFNRTQLEGSQVFAFPGNLPVTGTATVDDDLDRYGIGIGYNLPVANNTDLFARVGYERLGSADIDVTPDLGVPSRAKLDSTDGFSAEVGVRAAFTPSFEAGVSARHVSFDDPDVRIGNTPIDVSDLTGDESSTSLLVYGQFKFGNGWGVVAEGEIGDEYNALFVGARLSY